MSMFDRICILVLRNASQTQKQLTLTIYLFHFLFLSIPISISFYFPLDIIYFDVEVTDQFIQQEKFNISQYKKQGAVLGLTQEARLIAQLSFLLRKYCFCLNFSLKSRAQTSKQPYRP